jgi:lipid-binding SYLF domain-containing protein
MKILKTVLLGLVCLLLLSGFGFKKDSPEKQRQEIDQMAAQVLDDLYRQVPGSKALLEGAAGYAVFTSLGMNVLVVSTANGRGVAHYAGGGKKIYMKMLSAGTGVGMGVKDYRLIFVFQKKSALDTFVEEGWTAGAQADAAATHADQGDAAALAIDVSPGVKLFQLTESGVALQATIQGTKYWKNEDLN